MLGEFAVIPLLRDVGAAPAVTAKVIPYLLEDIGFVVVLLAVVVWLIFLSRRYKRKEKNQAVQVRKAADSWTDYARGMRTDLCAGRTPPAIRQWAIPLRQNEAFFLDTHMNYSRYYAQDVTPASTYVTYQGFLGTTTVPRVSGRARRNAERASAAQWRGFSDAHVLVSNQRLMVSVQGGAWMEFDYSEVAALYTPSEEGTIMLHFKDASVAPLSLHGSAMLAVTVLIVANLYGYDGLLHHPAMAVLDGPAGAGVQAL